MPVRGSTVQVRMIAIGPDARRSSAGYHPTCGTPLLLIEAAAEPPNGQIPSGNGMDVATRTMARVSVILQGRAAAEIERDTALAASQFTVGARDLKRFDFAVARPRFSAMRGRAVLTGRRRISVSLVWRVTGQRGLIRGAVVLLADLLYAPRHRNPGLPWRVPSSLHDRFLQKGGFRIRLPERKTPHGLQASPANKMGLGNVRMVQSRPGLPARPTNTA